MSPEFSDYAIRYSQDARAQRDALDDSLQAALLDITDELAENPDQYPQRTTSLGQDLFVYNHPEPAIHITYKIDRENKTISLLHLVAEATQAKTENSVFISYSHKDKKWLTELKKWLKPLEQQGLIDRWDDTEIKAGDEWRKEIEKALDAAKAAILLVSQDFVTSNFIEKDELPELLEKAANEGLKIFWIAVSASTITDSYPDIVKYQATHIDPPLDELSSAKRKQAFLEIYNKIKEVMET